MLFPRTAVLIKWSVMEKLLKKLLWPAHSDVRIIHWFSWFVNLPPFCCVRPNAECELGFFGAGCEQPCDCPGGGSCDPRTGDCSQRCPAGLHGDKCQLGETKIALIRYNSKSAQTLLKRNVKSKVKFILGIIFCFQSILKTPGMHPWHPSFFSFFFLIFETF